MRAAWRKLLPVMACGCAAAAVMAPMRAAALQMIDHWGGPQTRLDLMLDRASSNLRIVNTLACANRQAARTEVSLTARFDRVAAQASELLGREVRLTAINGGCASFDRPRFTRSVAQFDLYLERAALMIRRRETN